MLYYSNFSLNDYERKYMLTMAFNIENIFNILIHYYTTNSHSIHCNCSFSFLHASHRTVTLCCEFFQYSDFLRFDEHGTLRFNALDFLVRQFSDKLISLSQWFSTFLNVWPLRSHVPDPVTLRQKRGEKICMVVMNNLEMELLGIVTLR